MLKSFRAALAALLVAICVFPQAACASPAPTTTTFTAGSNIGVIAANKRKTATVTSTSPLRMGVGMSDPSWWTYSPPLVDATGADDITGSPSGNPIPDANRDASGNVISLPAGDTAVSFVSHLPATTAQRKLTWSCTGTPPCATPTVGNATGVTVDATNRFAIYTPIDVLGPAGSSPPFVHYVPASTSNYPINFHDRPVVDSGAVIGPEFNSVVTADTSTGRIIRFMDYTSVNRGSSPIWQGSSAQPATSVAGKAISSITFSGTTATVTTATAHGLLGNGTGSGSASITVTGATPATYNVTDAYVNNIDATHFSYTMAGTPTGNATVVGSYMVGDVNFQFTNVHFPVAANEPGTQLNEPIYTAANRNQNKADAHWHDGVPVETLASIAASANANAWYNAPPNADSTFYTAAANVWASFAATNNRDVYLEVGNEPWNFGFKWAHQLLNEANISGITTEQRYAQKVIEVANYFRTAFASAGASSHLHVVASWQNAGPTTVWSSMSTFLGPTDWAKITDLAVAPYYGDNGDAPMVSAGITNDYTGSTATMKAAISTDIDAVVAATAAHQVAAQALGKRLILYEGGNSVVLNNIAYKSAFERSSDAYDLELKFLQQLELKVASKQTGGLDLPSFNISYPLGANSFSWGQVEYISQTLSKATTPKLWAHVDFRTGTRVLSDPTGAVGPAPLAATVGTSLGFLNPSAYNVSWSLPNNDSGRLSIVSGTGEVKVAASLAPSGVHSFTVRQALAGLTRDTVLNYTVGGTAWNTSAGAPASSAAYAVSGGGLVATRASGSGDADVFASNGHSTGTYSFTVTPDRASGSIYFIGLANASESNTNFIGASANSIGIFNSDGNIYRNGGVVLASGATLGNTTPIKVLIDAQKAYFQVWNGSAFADVSGQNYAARTGGIDISGMGTLYPAADCTAGVTTFTIDATNWP